MGVSRIEHFLVPYNEGGRWLRLSEKDIPECRSTLKCAMNQPPSGRSAAGDTFREGSAVVLFRNAVATRIAFESISNHSLRLHSLISSGRY